MRLMSRDHWADAGRLEFAVWQNQPANLQGDMPKAGRRGADQKSDTQPPGQ